VANSFLGYPYFLRGTVIEGDKIGRSIDFPTANIYIDEKYKLIPKNGVYAVKVKVQDGEYFGMLNIGNRPTIPGREFSMEVHIFDFNDDIYGQTIEVGLIKRIRDEEKFKDLSALKAQLNLDKETAKKILT
jgi:riboflavin kinase/FMN adenylyltransferase